MKIDIPNNFYRISVKGLILDESKRFLLCKENNGWWDFPGGGLDFGETAQECITREINEEMGLTVNYVGDDPLYFITGPDLKNIWRAIVIYEVRVVDLTITESEECVEIKFFDVNEAKKKKVFSTVDKFLSVY